MLVVNSISGSPYSKRRPSKQSPKFKGLLDEFEEHDVNEESLSDTAHQMDDVLNEYIAMLRLKLNKLGYNQKIPQKASLYSSNIRTLIDMPEKKHRKRICHECQLSYQQNSMREQSSTTCFSEDEKVNISV